MEIQARTLLELHIKRQIRFLQLELERLAREAEPAAPAPAAPEPKPAPAAPDPDPTEDWMRAALDDQNFSAWLRLKRDGVL